MGPTMVLPAPDGPHVGPMNLAIREGLDVDQSSPRNQLQISAPVSNFVWSIMLHVCDILSDMVIIFDVTFM